MQQSRAGERGAGRHAVALMVAGPEVVGIDVSPGALAVACERGVQAVQGSIGDLPASIGKFETIVFLGNNLGLLGSPENTPAILDHLVSITARNGRIIASGLDPYTIENPEHAAYHGLEQESPTATRNLRIRVRDGRFATEWFDYLLVSD